MSVTVTKATPESLPARLRRVAGNIDLAAGEMIVLAPADLAAFCARSDALVKALRRQLTEHWSTWMAARADVEGAEQANALFNKEPSVIEARAALADYEKE